jgi:chromosome segregation ATPase
MATAVRPKLTLQPAMDCGDEEGRREIERQSSRSAGWKDLKRERDEALSDLKGVKRERDEARQLVSEWRRKCGVMQTECSKSKQECDDLRRRNSECQAIIDELERMKEARDDSGVGNEGDVKRDLQSQSRDTVIRNQELERLRKTTAEYEARISGLESQREELVERIGLSAGREGELGRALEAEQQAKEKANSRNRALSQQIAELHERFERLSHDRLAPGEENDKLQRECQTLKEENVMTWKRYTEAAHERDRVSKELYRVLDKLRASSEELEVMNAQLKEEQARRQELEKRMVENMGQRTDTGGHIACAWKCSI